jgi:hypothetical protein
MRANARFVNLPLPGDCKEEGTSEHRGKRMTDINRRPPETNQHWLGRCDVGAIAIDCTAHSSESFACSHASWSLAVWPLALM